MITLENDYVRLVVHEATGTITELVDKTTGTSHVLSRRPELELKEPGMGIFEIEPFIKNWTLGNASEASIRLTASEGGVTLVKDIELRENKVHIRIEAYGVSRVRELAYLACGNGGYWDEALGAMYSCRYFVSFGFSEPVNSFSSVGLKPPTSGFRFSKHSYMDRYFPELRWIAFTDTYSRNGLVVRCLSDCYGIVEDQFFNIELNLVSRGSNHVVLEYELVLIHGLSRVDYVDDQIIAGVESPSVVAPGQSLRGTFVVYPLVDLGVIDVKASLRFVKQMPVLGRRGYDVDRVRPGEYTIPVKLSDSSLRLTKHRLVSISFETEPLRWSMEDTLYSVSYVEFNIGGRVVSRAFSINPDYGMAIEFVRRRDPRLLDYIGDWSDEVEGFYDDKLASIPAYELAVEELDEARVIVKANSLQGRALEILESYIRGGVRSYPAIFMDTSTMFKKGYPTTALADGVLKAALAHRYLGHPIDDALKGLKAIVDAYRSGTLIHWFNGIHGGGGSAGLHKLVLAYDILQGELPDDLRLGLKMMFRWTQGELIRLTNAWAGNWELAEALALSAISVKFRFRDSSLGLAKAEAVFENALNTFLDDGGWVEESAGYHNAVLNIIINAAEILRTAGIDIYSVKRGGKPIIRLAVEWLWNLLDPRLRMPALEDSDDSMPSPDPFIVAGVRYSDPALVKIGLRLIEQGSTPTTPFTALVLAENQGLAESPVEPRHSKVTVLDQSGRFIIRSGDEASATYFILDYGPHGAWHGHPDKLSFELHANGEPLIVDAGSAGYYSELHWAWSRRSIAHNTVTLEDRDQLETRGRLLRYSVDEGRVYALFEAETYPGILHRRAILDIDDAVFTIVDEVKGVGKFRWNIHCMGNIKAMGRNHVALTTGRMQYTVALPKTPEVTYGWRGRDKRTIYMYYEEESSGEIRMWGVVATFQADVTVKGGEVVLRSGDKVYNIDVEKIPMQ